MWLTTTIFENIGVTSKDEVQQDNVRQNDGKIQEIAVFFPLIHRVAKGGYELRAHPQQQPDRPVSAVAPIGQNLKMHGQFAAIV